MIKRLLLPTISILLFTFCSQEKPDIQVACETNFSGNYLIKWETFPTMEGNVKIYESFTPDSFNLFSPIAESEINKGFKEVLAMRTLNRSYFKLVFNKKYSVITAERIIPMETLYNFRDLGGYYNDEHKQTKWGKLYRSSSLATASVQDRETLKNLGIKTLIDFRPESEKSTNLREYHAPQIYNLPLRGNRFNVFFDNILSEKMMKGDVLVHLEDVLSFLLENNSDYFTEMFDILLDENNYPIVMHCSLGKDRTGVASALILAAIGIDREQILNDFVLSNESINFNALFANADMFTSNVQETITALFSAHKETLIYSFDRIAKEYGSVDNYLEQELNLTPKKRERLKELMLYQSVE